MSRAVTSCLAESLARVSSWTPVLVRATFFVYFELPAASISAAPCQGCFKLFLRGLLSFRAVFCSRALFGYCCAILRCELPLSTRLWPLLNFCLGLSSQRDILDSGNLPPFLDVPTPAVAVRALARVPAQLSTSARGSGSLARRGVGIARAGQFRWVGLGVKLRARGRPGGPTELFCYIRLRGGSSFVSRTHSSKFLGAEITASEL